MQVIGDKNQISEDVFDFMISNLPFHQKSIRSELAKFFSISIFEISPRQMSGPTSRSIWQKMWPLKQTQGFSMIWPSDLVFDTKGPNFI